MTEIFVAWMTRIGMWTSGLTAAYAEPSPYVPRLVVPPPNLPDYHAVALGSAALAAIALIAGMGFLRRARGRRAGAPRALAAPSAAAKQPQVDAVAAAPYVAQTITWLPSASDTNVRPRAPHRTILKRATHLVSARDWGRGFGEKYHVDELGILVDYRDAEGAITRDRLISLNIIFIAKVGDSAPRATAAHGFCHLRHAWQTFRTDRMLRLADAETGEVAANPTDWLTRQAISGT